MLRHLGSIVLAGHRSTEDLGLDLEYLLRLGRDFQAFTVQLWTPALEWLVPHEYFTGMNWYQITSSSCAAHCGGRGGNAELCWSIRRRRTTYPWQEGEETKCCLNRHQTFYSLDQFLSLISVELTQREYESIQLDFLFLVSCHTANLNTSVFSVTCHSICENGFSL